MPEEINQDTNVEVLEEQSTTQPQGEEQPENLSSSEDPIDGELPEGTKDRTREQFEKLKQSNAELKAELEKRKQMPSVLDYLGSPKPVPQEVRQKYEQPQQQAPVQVQEEEKLLDDEGYVNAKALEKRLASIEEVTRKAEEAERRAREAQERIMRYEQSAEEKQLYAAYPELDPVSDKFDQDAYDLVRNELTSQIVNTGTRDAIKAAERMSKFFRKQEPKNQEVLEQRNQAVRSAGTTTRVQSNTDLAELKARSANDPKAVYERLKRLGM